MNKVAISIVAVAGLFAAPALAADMAVKAPPAPVAAPDGWAGFYLGAAAGLGWNDPAVSYAANDLATAAVVNGTVFLPGEQPLVSAYRLRQTGPVGGLAAGYNWHVGASWLWGLEADFNLSALDGRATGTSTYLALPGETVLQSTTTQQSTPWYGTIRGRLGWLATPNLFLFGTGGLAYGRLSNAETFILSSAVSGTSTVSLGGASFTCVFNTPCFFGGSSAIKTGWSAGGGVEWRLDHHWSAKVEYQLVDFGNQSVRVTASTLGFAGGSLASFTATLRDEFQLVRLGLNYRF
jgi:outer membrane immunogenic protein